uniref:Uncharacterized protein n=1 Tax=Kalanchoe fedtschenkoi TaxID=63787 RepID=A0A7N0TYP0_KALFE
MRRMKLAWESTSVPYRSAIDDPLAYAFSPSLAPFDVPLSMSHSLPHQPLAISSLSGRSLFRMMLRHSRFLSTSS